MYYRIIVWNLFVWHVVLHYCLLQPVTYWLLNTCCFWNPPVSILCKHILQLKGSLMARFFINITFSYRIPQTSEEKLKHALFLTLTLTSGNNLPITIDWLQKFCDSKIDCQSDEVCKFVVPSLEEIASCLVTAKVKDISMESAATLQSSKLIKCKCTKLVNTIIIQFIIVLF